MLHNAYIIHTFINCAIYSWILALQRPTWFGDAYQVICNSLDVKVSISYQTWSQAKQTNVGNMLPHETKPTYNQRLCQPHQDSKGAGASNKAGGSEQMKKGDSITFKSQLWSLKCAESLSQTTHTSQAGSNKRLWKELHGFRVHRLDERKRLVRRCSKCVLRWLGFVWISAGWQECDVHDVHEAPHAGGYKQEYLQPVSHASSFLLHESTP